MLRDRDRFDLVAHFPTAEKARMAVGTFGGQMKEESTTAFGPSSWIGLGIGIVLGVALGMLLSRNFPAPVYPPPVLSQRTALVIVLWAVILGASGWIVGSAIRLFSSVIEPDHFELHITIRAEKLAKMRTRLVSEGATAVMVRDHAIAPPDIRMSAASLADTAPRRRGS